MEQVSGFDENREADRVMAEMDADGGGSVSFAELVRLRQRQLTHYSLLTTLHYLLLLLTTHDSQLTAY